MSSEKLPTKHEERTIELTRNEIIYLWQKVHMAEFPEGLSLRAAAEAVLLTIGAHAIRTELDNRNGM